MIHKDFSENSNPVPGNGKLTPELFEAGGIPVTETTARPAPKVGTFQPSKAEVIRLGAEAMTRLAEGRSWDDWVAVMRVLDIARTTAMLEANTNKPQGHRYREAIAKWFRVHDEDEVFSAIDKADRSRLLKCFDNLAALSYWRDCIMSPEQRLKVTYPPTVFSRWLTWGKDQARAEEAAGDEPSPEEAGGDEPSSAALAGLRLADIWSAASLKEKQEVLDHEGRAGLAEIVSPSLLAELGDHAIAQQINSTPSPNVDSKSTDVRVVLTKIFRQIAGATTPEALSNALAAFKRKYEANHLEYRDLLITFPKKRAPKKR